FSEANLNGVNLSGVDFSEANFSRVDFTGVDLSKAILRNAHLEGANLSEVNLFGKNLSDADLRDADLRKANLREANLNRADLSRSDLTGTQIYRATRHEWRIEGIKCDYIFCDPAGEIPFPKDRNFRPGEFERLFRQLPTLGLALEPGAGGLDAFALDQAVQMLNEKRPELELKLDGFHSGGQPQADLTVLRKEYCNDQLREEIRAGYQVRMAALRRSQAAPPGALSVRAGGPELRKSRRYERLETVLVEKSESETIGPAQLNNFSAEGLMLRSGFAIPPGESIRVRFEKPLLASISNVMNSKVVWCRDLAAQGETDARFGIGVSLVH
ncbi:partial Secreted effector protein PipB, partial [Anaerolineae bacterium]